MRRGRNAKQRQQGNKERRTDLHLLGIVAKRPRTSVGLGSCPELTEKLELVGIFLCCPSLSLLGTGAGSHLGHDPGTPAQKALGLYHCLCSQCKSLATKCLQGTWVWLLCCWPRCPWNGNSIHITPSGRLQPGGPHLAAAPCGRFLGGGWKWSETLPRCFF